LGELAITDTMGVLSCLGISSVTERWNSRDFDHSHDLS